MSRRFFCFSYLCSFLKTEGEGISKVLLRTPRKCDILFCSKRDNWVLTPLILKVIGVWHHFEPCKKLFLSVFLVIFSVLFQTKTFFWIIFVANVFMHVYIYCIHCFVFVIILFWIYKIASYIQTKFGINFHIFSTLKLNFTPDLFAQIWEPLNVCINI